MAYGRLEVYWPDGRLETHLLNTETVSIGRADGNTIPIDTDAVSRYHFSITKSGDDITLTDLGSQNGTYADGVRLESNKPHLLGDVEEIQVGALRILFRRVDETPTMPIPAQDDSTQRIERDKANIRLDLDHTRLNVWPAASGSAELAVLNTGDSTQRLSLRVSGMPNEWLRLTRSEIELDAGETVYVLLNIKPPRRPNTVPTRYEVTIEVAPVTQPELVVHALLEVNVQAFSGFGIAIVPQIDPSDPVSVFLHNQGSANLRISLSAIDKHHALTFKLPDSVLTLQPGQRLRVDVEVYSRNPPLMGAPQEHTFVIQAQSHDDSGFIAATSGTVRIPSRLPLWGVITAIGIALSVLALAVVLLFSLLTSAGPEINSVSVATDELAQGDELILSVDADNVDTYDVLVNDTVVLPDVPGDREQVVIDTSNLQGELNIDVIGRSRRGDVEASTTAFIYVPMHVESFTAQPDTLVRNVVGTLTIQWDVPGASVVRISGLTEFTNRLLQSSTEYPATHVLNGISGIPEDTLEIILFAEDEVGNALEETLRIPVIDAQCTATEDIVLYEGPSDRFQQVGSVPRDTTVVVTAQDAEADWLRVQLPGNVRGWGQDDLFDCDDSFNVSDLRTEMNLPVLPTAPVPTTAPTQGTANPPTSPTTAPTQQSGG